MHQSPAQHDLMMALIEQDHDEREARAARGQRTLAREAIVDRGERKKTWEKVFEVIKLHANSGARVMVGKLEEARAQDG